MNYILGLTIIGIISGITGGIFGAGAEILIVPLLTIFNIYGNIKTNIGTSLVMLLPPIGIFASYKFYKEGNVDVLGGLYMALIFTIFSWLSSNYTLKINHVLLRKLFGIFTIISGIIIYFYEI
tara:strand:+ start:1393 stop:1761 length:369 start_codon:yes stop_codon:yes gene_type:complete